MARPQLVLPVILANFANIALRYVRVLQKGKMILEINAKIDFNATAVAPFILLLSPRALTWQKIIQNELTIEPPVQLAPYQDVFGNACHRCRMPLGAFTIWHHSVVELFDQPPINRLAAETPIEDLPHETLTYLMPSRLVESDQFVDFGYGLTEGLQSGYDKVEAIRQWIFQNVKYEYGTSHSGTTAIDVNQSRLGVCRDFAHLGIALCRAINIPARMVSGYLYELVPMDMHAWFEAFIDGNWHAFDPTQKSTTGGRVVVGYGKDSNDIALTTQFGPAELLEMQVQVRKIL